MSLTKDMTKKIEKTGSLIVVKNNHKSNKTYNGKVIGKLKFNKKLKGGDK